MPTLEDKDFEFKDKIMKSTIKTFREPGNKRDGYLSINRLTEEAIEKNSKDNICFLDQYLLSQVRHEWQLNMLA